MAQWRVRPVDDLERDWAELRRLFLGLHEYHRPLGIPELVPDWEATWLARFEQGGDDDRLLLKADVGNRVIGFADAEIRRRPSIFDEEMGFINDMYVTDQWRGQGVGRDLLAKVEEWCAARGVARLHLTVVASNESALAAYTRWGFQPLSHRLVKVVSGERVPKRTPR